MPPKPFEQASDQHTKDGRLQVIRFKLIPLDKTGKNTSFHTFKSSKTCDER